MNVILSPRDRDVLERFQTRVADWKRARWRALAFGTVCLGTSAWLLPKFFRVAELLDEMNVDLNRGHGDALARTTAQLAVVLALRVAVGVVTGAFGLHLIVATVRYWSGRPEHLALSAIIEREFGIESRKRSV
jgi:hypothetical protein